MKKIYIFFLIPIILSCCKENHGRKQYDVPKMLIVELEKIYSNQQELGVELGPWYIFYEIKLCNMTDSVLKLYPKKDSVLLEKFQTIWNKNKALNREKLIKLVKSTPGIGDTYLLFGLDTVSLYCKQSPIILEAMSTNNFLFYTKPSDLMKIYQDRSFNETYKTHFQKFLSEFVKESTITMVIDKDSMYQFSPNNLLQFLGNSEEQSEWMFW